MNSSGSLVSTVTPTTFVPLRFFLENAVPMSYTTTLSVLRLFDVSCKKVFFTETF